MEFITARNGKPNLVLDDYQYRIQRKSKIYIRWLCLKERKEHCLGSVKTDLQCINVISKTDHTCIPNYAEIEVKKVMEECKKEPSQKFLSL